MKKNMIYKSHLVGKEEFKILKLLCDAKYFYTIAKAVGCCCLWEKNISDSVGNHVPAKGIQ